MAGGYPACSKSELKAINTLTNPSLTFPFPPAIGCGEWAPNCDSEDNEDHWRVDHAAMLSASQERRKAKAAHASGGRIEVKLTGAINSIWEQ